MHNGLDPRTGKQLGPKTGDPEIFKTYDDLFAAFRKQLHHFVEIKIRGSRLIERMYADHMPAPFLSVLIDDCIANGRDYNAGGARYNNTFIQMVGLGSITDCLSAVKQMCYDQVGNKNKEGGRNGHLSLSELVGVLDKDFSDDEILRQRLVNKTHKYGNDDNYADDIMLDVFNACFEEVDGRPYN